MTGHAEQQDDAFQALLAEGRIRLQRCDACGHVRPPTRWICPECLAEAWQWVPVSGDGVVEAFTWYMQPFDPRFTEVPYNVALVRLDEGVRMMANILDVEVGELKVGQRVRAEIVEGLQGGRVLAFRRGTDMTMPDTRDN